MRVNLSAAEDTVNAEIIEDLLYFVCDDGRRDKVPSGVTNPSGVEPF